MKEPTYKQTNKHTYIHTSLHTYIHTYLLTYLLNIYRLHRLIQKWIGIGRVLIEGFGGIKQNMFDIGVNQRGNSHYTYTGRCDCKGGQFENKHLSQTYNKDDDGGRWWRWMIEIDDKDGWWR